LTRYLVTGCAGFIGSTLADRLLRGTDAYCEVNDSVGWICEALGIAPARTYTGGDRAWLGDNPFILLDYTRPRGER
jgi:nucleoside-diphosphate-sugar epimerase